MTLFAWIILGLVSGLIASSLVHHRGERPVFDVVLGVVGAVVGGSVFNALGIVGVSGFNLWSVFVSLIGAVVALAGYHAIARLDLV
jgi:uncharacterized membrane protein YeaQ/YmgE (transglycosylase-associated protein family)